MQNSLTCVPLILLHPLIWLWNANPCRSWTVLPPRSSLPLSVRTNTAASTRLYAGYFDDDDDDDDDDGMIWSADDDEDDEEEDDDDWADETAAGSSLRRRLEMQWELSQAAEDCNVEEPQSCGSEPCQDCNGKGWNPCRFCRGTGTLYLPYGAAEHQHDFVSCKVCQQGHERCRSCQGTGWVARWTHLQGTAH